MSTSTAVASRPALPPALGIVVGVIAVSTASIFIRLAQQAGAQSLAIAMLRLTIASLVLLPFALGRCAGEFRCLSSRDLITTILSGAFLGGHFATWILSLEYTSVVSSVVLVTLSPLFVALASAIFLREPVNSRMALGMVIAIAGGILIGVADSAGSSPGQNPPLGNALALAGAVCIAPYLIIARALRSKLSLLAYITLVYGAAALILCAVVVLTQTPLGSDSALAYLWIALLALVPQLIGHTSFNWSVRRLPAVYATIPVLGEPVGSTILAVILLGETITLLTLAGAALALSGIALMSLKRSAEE